MILRLRFWWRRLTGRVKWESASCPECERLYGLQTFLNPKVWVIRGHKGYAEQIAREHEQSIAETELKGWNIL